jgi:predicted DNA-binding mobile mystery protein A
MNKTDWIRSVRKQMGLKGFQLAERLQVSPARVSVLERDEMRGAVTLKMMQKAASAMGCRFEYQIVPDTPTSNEGDGSGVEKPRYRVVAE